MNHEYDPLRDRLESEASAERPAFSPALHRDLMSHIRNPQNAVPRHPRRLLASAAALLLIASITALLAWRTTRTPQPPTQSKVSQHPAIAPNNPLAFQLGNLLSARAWPPQLTIALPLPDMSPAPQSQQARTAPTALPQWTIAKIEAQPQAQMRALANVLPDDLKSLLRPLATRLLTDAPPR